MTEARLNGDGTFTLRHMVWVGAFPISSFAGWLAFFGRMAKRRPDHYGPSFAALEALRPAVAIELAGGEKVAA